MRLMDVRFLFSFFRKFRFDFLDSRGFRKGYFFGFPVLVLFFAEAVSRSDAQAFFVFLRENFPVALFSYVWLLSIQTLLFFIFGKTAFLVFPTASAILILAHAEKLKTLAEPLYATDVFVHASALGTIAGFSQSPISQAGFAALVFSAVTAFLGSRAFSNFSLVRFPFEGRKRFFWTVVFLTVNAVVFTNAFGALSTIQKAVGLTPEEYSWRQLENYERNGFF